MEIDSIELRIFLIKFNLFTNYTIIKYIIKKLLLYIQLSNVESFFSSKNILIPQLLDD